MLRTGTRIIQLHERDRNSTDDLHFLSVFPSLTRSIRKGMGNQAQPFEVPVKLTPTANVAGMGKQEIDWSVEFVGPLSAVSDGPSMSIDQDD